MATLVYRGVRLDVVKTVDYQVTPVQDPSGLDRKCSKVVLTVEGVFSEYGLGTGKPPGYGVIQTPGFPNWGARGDQLGVTLYNLRDHMMAPRGILEYYVANVLVLEAPQRLSNGSRLPCDVLGGPFPRDFRMSGPVTGDKAAWCTFTIETYVNNCDQFLLSNRWRIHDRVDEHYFASLTIQGVATFRMDFLAHTRLQADDWRRFLVYPVEPKMKRVSVDVNVSYGGDEVEYVVHDRETNYGTGQASVITKVDCHVYANIDYPYKTLQDVARLSTNIAQQYASGLDQALRLNLVGSAVTMAAAQQTLHFAIIPSVNVSGVARVWGVPGTNRLYLLRVAHALVHDRCRGFNTDRQGIQVGTHISVDWSSDAPPFVQFEAQFLVSPLYAVRAFFNDPEGLFNWDERIDGNPVMALGWDQNTPRAALPGAHGVRAENIGRIVSQILENGVCQPVSAPPFAGDVAKGRKVKSENVDAIG